MFNHKNKNTINKFFKLERIKVIDDFKIYTHIQSLTGKDLNLIFEKYAINFFL